MTQNDDLVLSISVGRRHRGRVRNETWSWAQLVEKLSTAEVGRETLAEYRAMDKEQQLLLKNVGFFVAGTCRDGVRRKDHIEDRSLVCLDFDDVPPTLLDRTLEGDSPLCGIERFVHTTRKHRAPDSIRFRLVIPLAEPITPELYEPVARMVASWADPGMEYIDKVSFRAAQYMFFPSRSRDGEFLAERRPGRLLRAETVLLEYLVPDDPSEWPRRADENLHSNVNAEVVREDPRERLSAPAVAAFCRVYDVHDAISTFLSDVYGEAHGSDGDRYTYLAGSSAAGARVYDDGLYLHSEHDTDPANGQHNAFDLVRIHLYGRLDEGVDFTLTPLSRWPSYLAMQDLLAGDPRLQEALAEVEREAYAERCRDVLGALDGPSDNDDYDLLDDLDGPPSPEPGPRSPDEATDRLAERIVAAQSIKTLDTIASTVRRLALIDFPQRHRDRLADLYARRVRELSEGKFTLTRAEAKKHLRPTEKASREALRRAGMPPWLEGWCYLTGDDRFLHLLSGERISAQGFNAKYDARCAEAYPSEETGLPAIRPAEAATALFEIPTPFNVQYWPGRGRLYEYEGLEYANTYRDTGARPDGYEGDFGVRLLKRHLTNLLPRKRDRALLLDFLAHVRQNPERKLRYALVLKGVRGDGKSLLIELMKACMGHANCTDVHSSMLSKSFNAWASDTCFIGVEEVKQHGPNGFEVLNNLKPLITNDHLAIERKGKDVVTVRNFANLFMTTNYSDALPLENGENRYLVLATRFLTEEQRQEWEAEWEAEHGFRFYEALWEELRERPYQFRRFLEEYEFSEWYNPSARAPETDWKQQMVEDAKPDERQLLEDVLERDDEPLCTSDIFCWWRFKQILDAKLPHNRMNGRAVSSMMHAMGFLRAGQERFENINHSQGWVWTRNTGIVGDGRPLSPEGKRLLAEALRKWEAQEDFDLGNVVPLRR